MKSHMESGGRSGSGNVLGGVRADGRVHKSSRHQSNPQKLEENAEIKAYLNKLQELVPFMPKNKKLTKLEVITHVIDYIRDLRQTLGLPPCIAEQGVATTPFDVQSAMIMSQAVNTNDSATDSTTSAPITSSTTLPHPLYRHHHQRQPLCVITNPNGNVNSTTQEILELMDKSPSADVDTRPVSC